MHKKNFDDEVGPSSLIYYGMHLENYQRITGKIMHTLSNAEQSGIDLE